MYYVVLKSVRLPSLYDMKRTLILSDYKICSSKKLSSIPVRCKEQGIGLENAGTLIWNKHFYSL
jgi:hypothetical protein